MFRSSLIIFLINEPLVFFLLLGFLLVLDDFPAVHHYVIRCPFQVLVSGQSLILFFSAAPAFCHRFLFLLLIFLVFFPAAVCSLVFVPVSC